MIEYDLIVIGSGSGLDVAVGAAEQGMKVAVVEKDRMGGTCLNRGCIPSKMLIHSADIVETLRTAHLFGIKVKGFEVDFASIIKRVSESVDRDSDDIENGYKEIDNPKLYKVESRFIAHKTLQVGDEVIRAEKVLLSSGGEPSIPTIQGLREAGFITSDQALRLKTQPKVMTILGGGYIAAELAHFYGSLGTEINIVHRHPSLLNKEDEEIAARYTEIVREKYRVYTNYEPLSVTKKEGGYHVEIKRVKGSEKKTLESDQLLVATGRTPVADRLDVAKTGVKTDEKGYIITDEHLQTNIKGIFALGDAVGHFLFKHAANHEAGYVFNNVLRKPDELLTVDYTAMPHAIFTSPQIAGVGSTEQELKAKGTHYSTAKYNYIDTAMGEAIEDKTGFVKFLVDHERKILGCHILGTHASILIHEVLVSMKSGSGTLEDLTDTIHIHPALNEVVQRAATSL